MMNHCCCHHHEMRMTLPRHFEYTRRHSQYWLMIGLVVCLGGGYDESDVMKEMSS